MEKAWQVVVVGVGAIGGVTAVLMKLAGYHVEVVCKYPDLAEKIRKEGLMISGIRGVHRVTMPAVAEIEELEGKKDIVFLATKATDMMDAVDKLLPFLRDNSLVVSMQNGICEEALAEVLGRERVVGCVVGWGATLLEPGKLEMTSTGDFAIGNIMELPTERLEPVREMLQAVVPVTISTNIMGSLYAKLIVNSCITSLGAICGLYLGEMLKKRKIRNIFITIMIEAMAVADAMGLKVESMAGLNYSTLLSSTGLLSRLRQHLVIRLIGFKFRRLKSSSLQSLERGKPTEIQYFNGYIQRKGQENGVATPINKRIAEIVKEIEEGNRSITVKNFEDPAFDGCR